MSDASSGYRLTCRPGTAWVASQASSSTDDLDLADPLAQGGDDAVPLRQTVRAQGVAQDVAALGLVQRRVPGLPGRRGTNRMS